VNLNHSRVEFFHPDKAMPFLSLEASFYPFVGALISIRKVTYKVLHVDFAVDYADDYQQQRLRASVIVEPAVQTKPKRKKKNGKHPTVKKNAATPEEG
jgi:hypothetical protein